MQQRQPRLGDILDDYCPRERRVTNHAVVAMIGQDVKQTRCTTCDAEHEYKHARVPRQRRKSETPPALLSQAVGGGPKRVVHEHEPAQNGSDGQTPEVEPGDRLEPKPLTIVQETEAAAIVAEHVSASSDLTPDTSEESEINLEDGPVHRPLIRATLPRPEGQPPPSRPVPEFTLRQPGRPGSFRPRHQRGAALFHGNRSGNTGGTGGSRPVGGRPPAMSRSGRRHGQGRKRSK